MNVLPERRLQPRFSAAIAIQIDGCAGVTTNISANGLYFLTEQPLTVGQQVPLVLPFVQAASAGVLATCTAQVVRVDTSDEGQYGVALTYEPDSVEHM